MRSASSVDTVNKARREVGDDHGKIGGRLAAGAVIGILLLGVASAFSLAKDAPTTEDIVTPTVETTATAADTTAVTTQVPATVAPVVAVLPTCPLPDDAPTTAKAFTAAPVQCIDPKARYRAVIATSEGEFTIELDQQRAPLTTNNFVFLARKGFYNGLTFHRVIPGFIIQGGDPKANGTGGPGYTIPDEISPNAKFQIGTVAMANSGPNQNGSQFFVVTGKNGENIPNTSSVFARVVKGTKTLDAIDALGVPPTPDGQELAPQRPITITSITVTAKGEDTKRIPGVTGLVPTTTSG